MQPPSACPCRGCIPWQGILLAVSLLTFWNPQPTAQLTIEPVPVDAAEGTDVLLLAHNASENVVGYTWFKGDITDSRHQIVSYSILTQTATPGTAFSGRETIYPNGSLLFVNVTQEDTGSYTLQTTRNDFSNEVATGEFRVHEKLLKPYITSNNSQPVESEDSIALTCEPETKYTTYLWWINNQRIPDGDRQELSNDTRTLILFNVTRNDTGLYVCEARNPVSFNQSDPLALNISYGPDTPIINPTDTHFRPGTNLSLFCYADSYPPAQYSWFFNGSPLESTQTLLVPNISTNNSGSYMCVANNSVTGLSRSTTKIITVSDVPDPEPGLSDGAIAGIVIGAVAGVALIAGLVYFLFFRKTGGASDQHDLTEHKPSASNHSRGPSDLSPDKVDEVAYSSLNFNVQQPKQPTSATSLSPTHRENIYSEVKKK
uniref:Ig-like domain-containing protein n=1 Tax=Sciurus vulgaris TaxID=55149 RepID=A0A8D2DY65_SCIVU